MDQKPETQRIKIQAQSMVYLFDVTKGLLHAASVANKAHAQIDQTRNASDTGCTYLLGLLLLAKNYKINSPKMLPSWQAKSTDKEDATATT